MVFVYISDLELLFSFILVILVSLLWGEFSFPWPLITRLTTFLCLLVILFYDMPINILFYGYFLKDL